MLRHHASAATPVFIADATVADVERLRRSVGGALIGESAARWVIAIFDPIAKLGGRAAADVAGEIRLSANFFAEADELMKAEAVVLDVFAPVHVHALRTPGADAVAPMIIVGEAAAGPAEDGDAEVS